MTPRDQLARERIRTDLATNMLVEAGAGSGKTTSLVERMLEHVRAGTPVEKLTAVTFTRKAANELRERFQIRLEAAAASPATGEHERPAFTLALRELDRAFVGTIHAFCARLLRERPLEVSLDPGFSELEEDQMTALREAFWRRWVERARIAGDADLAALQKLAIDAEDLHDGFEQVVRFPDVEFPTGDAGVPDIRACRSALEKLMARSRALMPASEPAAGWDDLMRTVRRLEFRRSVDAFDNVDTFCEAVGTLSAGGCKVTQNRWAADGKRSPEAKQLSEDFQALLENEGVELLRCWREHRYPLVMRLLRRAATEFGAQRHSSGQLGFEDLLLLAARLLRENPGTRDELGARYAHLFVDEFQDTDPVQAEVCFLLASDSTEGTDWRTVTPRPGSLFVVGDPKQSIYRFRRADIEIYDLVKRRMLSFGAVLPLTTNFRSVHAVERLVNGHFAEIFPPAATREQAPFSPMETVRVSTAADGVRSHEVVWSGRSDSAAVEEDATRVASWIALRTAGGAGVHPEGKACSPGDFLILTERRRAVQFYARALAERNIPVSTAGAELAQEHELRELMVVLRALADPANPVRVAAALEGLFFGLTPGDLWDASRFGIRFSIAATLPDQDHPVARALTQLNQWWELSQRQSADIVLERIIGETGLLFYAAGEQQGDARAGTLLHLVDSLRASASEASLGITEAMIRLETVLAGESPDCSLRPGRTDSVRVMNLHKAKGLEARIVILAAPVEYDTPAPLVHISRTEAGTATGGICITRKDGQQRRILAHPPGWSGMEAAEAGFLSAERERRLYVAATRARDELLISRATQQLKSGSKPDASMWRPLVDRLEAGTTTIELPRIGPAERRAVTQDSGTIVSAVVAARLRVELAGAPSFTTVTVTEAAKSAKLTDDDYAPTTDPDNPVPAPRSAAGHSGRGKPWGRAVHRCIEALGRGRRGERLHAFIRAVARDEQLSGEDTERLGLAIGRIEASESWRELGAAGAPLVELTIMRCDRTDDGETISEGVLDAASRGEDGWRIVDWKTDAATGSEWVERLVRYDRQVAGYAAMLAALTGEAAHGTVERVGGARDE